MRFVWMAGVCLLVLRTPVLAQTPHEASGAAFTHVRGTTPQLQALIAGTADKSPGFRDMLQRLEASTVIVYVRAVALPAPSLNGRTAFLKVEVPSAAVRRLVVEISCSRPLLAQTTTLAHELRHALEIAEAPWVVVTKTLEQYYEQIGFRVDSGGRLVQFETVAAREAANRIRRELATSDERRRAASQFR